MAGVTAKHKPQGQPLRLAAAHKLHRVRMAIGRELEKRGITTPVAIGEALGMPEAEAIRLLIRHQWRKGDVAQLQELAVRPGVRVSG